MIDTVGKKFTILLVILSLIIVILLCIMLYIHYRSIEIELFPRFWEPTTIHNNTI